MLKVFAAAIFVSAALLFLVQPMAGKVLLPLLGGAPGVWNTCMVFFQAMLLLGYLYAHVLTTRVPVRYQALVHVPLVVVAALTLPAPVDVGAPAGESPEVWVLKTLLITVGPAFFILSTSGPLLQRWFSRTDHPAAKDPYFLYAASNAGSVLGLLAYPFAIETLLGRRGQAAFFAGGFWLFVPFVVACAAYKLKRPALAVAEAVAEAPIGWVRRARWIVLALVPSSLMLGVTQHLATDVASMPLLWVMPLLLYLVTFILAFSPRLAPRARTWGRVLPAAVAIILFAMLSFSRSPVVLLTALHLALFFIAAMMCHTRLAEDRPAPARLTEFYLCMSVGGVLGGLFNAILAPQVFDTVAEYPLMIGAACLLRPQLAEDVAAVAPAWRRWVRRAVAVACALALMALMLNLDAAQRSGALLGGALASATRRLAGGISDGTLVTIWCAAVPTVIALALILRRGSLRFALGALALLAVTPVLGVRGRVLMRERSFFGVHFVTSDARGSWHELQHGTTLHGVQARYEPASRRPTAYYHPTGPLGDVMKMLATSGRLDDAAFVGLGAGAAAAYALPGSTFVFYEIDPVVWRIASDRRYFTYISDAAAQPGVKVGAVIGDGRLRMRETAADAAYRLIAVDAFSSDSIPVHLLTREALELYLSKLKPDGVLIFHVSNRYFNLNPVLARLASELGLVCYARNDNAITKAQMGEGKRDSMWVAIARRAEDLGPVARPGTAWVRLGDYRDFPVWTDDHASLLSAFVGIGE